MVMNVRWKMLRKNKLHRRTTTFQVLAKQSRIYFCMWLKVLMKIRDGKNDRSSYVFTDRAEAVEEPISSLVIFQIIPDK